VGYYTSAFVFGAAGSTLLSGLVGSLAGWRLAIVTTAAGTLVGTLLCAWVLQDDRGVAAADAGRRIRLEVVRNRPALLMVLAYATHMWEQYGMRAWMAAFLAASFVQTGYSKAEAVGYGATLTAIIVAVGGFATGLAGIASDRIGRTRTASAIMLISAGFSLTFGWLLGRSLVLLVLCGLAYSFFVVAESPVLSTGLTELVPHSSLGAAMGFQTLIGFLAAIASPAVFGWVLDWTNPVAAGTQGGVPGIWGWAFGMLGLVALVGPVALTIVRRLPASARMANGKR
jgi:MFS family permease